jgi:hypothetical protein
MSLEAAGIRFVSAREVRVMLERGDRLTVADARDGVHYRRGRGRHLPAAISAPAEDRSLRVVDIRRPKRLLHPGRLPADCDAPFVLDCGGPD